MRLKRNLRILFFMAILLFFCPVQVADAQLPTTDSKIAFDHPLKLDAPANLALIQDRDGFIWISTQNGLVKYDGYTPLIYRTGTNSISGDNVVALAEDKDGSIWIGNQGGGIDKYDKQTNSFTHYRNDPKNPNSLSNDTISYSPQALFFDKDDRLWIGTQGGGLDRLNTKTGVFTHYKHDPNNPVSLSDNTAWSIIEDPAGNIWVGTIAGLDKFDRKTGVFTHYRNSVKDPQSIGAGWVGRVLVDKQNPSILWIGTIGGGLNRFDVTSGKFTRYSHDPKIPGELSTDQVVGLFQDDLGRLWVGWYGMPITGGLSIFDPKTGVFTDYYPNSNDPTSISTNQIRSIYQDRSGIIWLANFNGVIDKYDSLGQQFKLYQNDPHDPASLSDNAALTYYEDKVGVMWFGTLTGGLNRYNRDTNNFTRYVYDPKDPTTIRNNFVSRIFEDSGGTFWVATRGGTLSIFDRKTGKCVKHYQHDPKNPNSIPQNDSIRFIVEDKDNPNILWMGAFLGGFFRFDKSTEKFTNYPTNSNNPNSLNSDSVMHIYQDSEGIMWLSTPGGGLNRFDKKTGKFTHFINDPRNPTSIGSNQLWETQEFTSGFLWIASVGGGLERFDKQRQTFQRYTKENGFPTNGVLTIRRDSNGNLWMGTDIGLVRFNPDTGQTRIYKKSDGLQGDIFLDSAAWVTQNGEMWFGGVNGINSFYPDQLKDNSYKPPVYFTALTQGGEPIKKLGTAPEKAKQITLDWRSNFFEFEVAALNFTKPEKNQYQYFLEGFDKGWYNAGVKRTGRYSGLPDGNYTLRVRGSNNDGVWSDKEATLKVKVLGPFWRTMWFMSLVGLVVIGSIVGGVWYRSRITRDRQHELERQVAERKRNEERLKGLDKLKDDFLSVTTHELKTPLIPIKSQSQLLLAGDYGKLNKEQKGAVEMILRNEDILNSLSSEVLDIAKIKSNKLKLILKESQIDKIITEAVGDVNILAKQKGISLVILPMPRLPEMMIDELRIKQVMSNLLSNAVKFTQEKGKIWVELKKMPNEIRVSVKDSGIGIDKENIGKLFTPFFQIDSSYTRKYRGTGLGLAVSKGIVETHGGKIWVESEGEGKGSTFTFSLPIKNY